MAETLVIAKGGADCSLLPGMANRHGLIAGATGTGKTVTLRVIAESFSRIGVPVFMADVKGDLSGLARAGMQNPKIIERVEKLGHRRFSVRRLTPRFFGISTVTKDTRCARRSRKWGRC